MSSNFFSLSFCQDLTGERASAADILDAPDCADPSCSAVVDYANYGDVTYADYTEPTYPEPTYPTYPTYADNGTAYNYSAGYGGYGG